MFMEADPTPELFQLLDKSKASNKLKKAHSAKFEHFCDQLVSIIVSAPEVEDDPHSLNCFKTDRDMTTLMGVTNWLMYNIIETNTVPSGESLMTYIKRSFFERNGDCHISDLTNFVSYILTHFAHFILSRNQSGQVGGMPTEHRSGSLCTSVAPSGTAPKSSPTRSSAQPEASDKGDSQPGSANSSPSSSPRRHRSSRLWGGCAPPKHPLPGDTDDDESKKKSRAASPHEAPRDCDPRVHPPTPSPLPPAPPATTTPASPAVEVASAPLPMILQPSSSSLPPPNPPSNPPPPIPSVAPPPAPVASAPAQRSFRRPPPGFPPRFHSYMSPYMSPPFPYLFSFPPLCICSCCGMSMCPFPFGWTVPPGPRRWSPSGGWRSGRYLRR